MDRKLSKNQEIQQLIQLSEAARACLSSEASVLKARLDVPTRIRSSLKENPAGWLFGSLGSGLAASLLLRRGGRKTSADVFKKPRSLPASALGLALNAAKPLAKIWLTNQLKNYLTGHAKRSKTPAPQSHDIPF